MYCYFTKPAPRTSKDVRLQWYNNNKPCLAGSSSWPSVNKSSIKHRLCQDFVQMTWWKNINNSMPLGKANRKELGCWTKVLSARPLHIYELYEGYQVKIVFMFIHRKMGILHGYISSWSSWIKQDFPFQITPSFQSKKNWFIKAIEEYQRKNIRVVEVILVKNLNWI